MFFFPQLEVTIIKGGERERERERERKRERKFHYIDVFRNLNSGKLLLISRFAG